MPMDAQVRRVEVGAVEHDVVRLEKLAAGHGLEAQAEDVAAVDGIGVRVADLEGGDGGADAVEALLDVGSLPLGLAEELGLGSL
jgi:hypothetical protein